MQGHENERDQDPVFGSGGARPPFPPTGGEEPSGHEPGGHPPESAGQPPPANAAGQPPPADAAGQPPPADADRPEPGLAGQQTDAIWFGGQQAPPYGPASQPPPYPEGWQPSGGGWSSPGGGAGPWGVPPQSPRGNGRRLLAFLLVAILGVGIGALAAYGLANGSGSQSPSSNASSVPNPGSGRAPLQNTGTSKLNVSAIAHVVTPSVANITSKLETPNQNATAEGTGIVISPSGLLLTNNHVIYQSTLVTAQVSGTGRTYKARVLGTDKTDDIALLQLEGASGLKAAPIGDSSKVALGDPVVAIGNLGGQGGTPTVTSGAITALNRTITAGDQGSANTETLHGVMQTNAAIGAGDSGGPLVNASGQVIGIDTAAASTQVDTAEHIGFAIPVNNALKIAREIAAGHGSSTIQIGLPAFLGVSVCDIARAAECMNNGFSFGGFDNTSIAPVSSGALVAGVIDGTPAQAAGMTAGDVITRLDGAGVTSAESLTNVMRSHRPGDRVSVTWVDSGGQRHTETVTLATGPAA